MQARTLGETGIALSRLGLGGYELGPESGTEPDVDRAVRVIQASMDAGINWLDSAEAYHDGGNELLIGSALTRAGGGMLVATKVGPGESLTSEGSGFRHDQIHTACRSSLGRLGRDVIDVYFLHWPDESGVPLEETWGAMSELVDQGLVRAIGMSNYQLDDIKACHGQRPVDVVQTGLSLIDHLEERDLIAGCGDLGIGVVIFEPLASGILTGKSMQQVTETWSAWVESAFWQRLLAPGKAERSFAVADAMTPIADRLGASVPQVAIAWVLAQAGVTAAIAGSRDGRHVDENAGAVDLALGEALSELEALIPLGPAFG
ncbi:MAG: aldo/keto reductase [Sporichthyaceae bacterium]